MSGVLWVFFATQVILSFGAQHDSEEQNDVNVTVGPGERLFLTPYIERGDIITARQLAEVHLNNTLQIESYAGFFTVKKAYNSNQFFWYFPSMSSDKEHAPVLVWLQGGPGASSLFGLFNENGPMKEQNGQFVRREYHWALNHHVIYIDNPVGAGFSFTKDEKGYCTDETQVGEQLYSSITQFFQLFPELQKNDFFITGESYAGKYVPVLAHTILKKEPTAKVKVNLKGLIIGGAFINPETQNLFRRNTERQIIKNTVRINSKYPTGDDMFITVLNKSEVRKAIHVGDLPYYWLSLTVYAYMYNESEESMAPWLSELLDHYPVTLYGGENDETVPYAGIVDFLRNHFNFTGADEYKTAKRYAWKVDGQLAGCVRQARLLTDIFVFNATHYVPKDQPKRAWDMITRLTRGQGFDQKEICTKEQLTDTSC